MDLFYFNSQSEPAVQRKGRDLKCRGKPSAKRRKVGSTMDSSSYRAHVVRVVEPTVVANDLASLPTYYLNALLDAGYLPPSPSLPLVTQTGQISDNSIAKIEERTSVNEPPTSQNGSVPPSDSRTISQTTSPIDHPRPESSDLWEEEDSRRIRFAFPDENDDHVERLSRSYIPARATHSRDEAFNLHELASPQDAAAQPPFHTLPRSIDPLDLFQPQPLATSSFAERFALPVLNPPPLPLYSTGQPLWNDNLIAVDDHCRSYDFVDFMNEWKARSSLNHDLPAFEPVTEASPWRKPQRDYVRHNTPADRRDMQGLSWEAFGVQKSSALKARRLLHSYSAATPGEHDITPSNSDELHYKPRAFAPNHRARFSHYQLRNMTATNGGRVVYYARGSKIKTASLSSPTFNRTAMDLKNPFHSASPFKVTCLTTSASSGYGDDEALIAGGFNGEYAILDLTSTMSSKPSEGIASHAKDGIVNYIDTFRDRQSGSPRAAFCSNDHKVRVMDLRRQHFTSTFEYDSAINCSTMSCDGRLRALVHDGSDGWITNAETGEILVKLKAHTDFAFACDWSPCGRYVATGAEDRQVILWDARKWTLPLRSLDCVMSCARSLRFTDDGALVIAESEDVVSIVDTASFGRRQDIRFFGSIAGLSLLDGGAEVVVANSDQSVGGLMSFQRVAQLRGSGGFGQRMVNRFSSRQRRQELESCIAEQVFV